MQDDRTEYLWLNLPQQQSTPEDQVREAEAVALREQRHQAFLQMQEAHRQEQLRWSKVQADRAEANRQQRLRVWGGPLRPHSERWVDLPAAEQKEALAYLWRGHTWLQAGSRLLNLAGGPSLDLPQVSRIRPEHVERPLDEVPRLEYDLGDGRSLWSYRFWHLAGSASGPRDSVREQFVLFDGQKWSNLVEARPRIGYVEGACWRLFFQDQLAVLRVTIDACEGLDMLELFDWHFSFDLKTCSYTAQEKAPPLGPEIPRVPRVSLNDTQKLSPLPWPVDDSQGLPWISSETTRMSQSEHDLLGLGLTPTAIQVLHWRIPT